METIRQGDVLLIPIDRGDPEWVGVTRRSGVAIRREEPGIVLAHGEATGHHHHIKARTTSYRQHRLGRRNRRILHVGHRGATLEHQEHSPIDLAPGRYEVVRQTEYTPAERARPTRDTTASFETRSYVFD